MPGSSVLAPSSAHGPLLHRLERRERVGPVADHRVRGLHARAGAAEQRGEVAGGRHLLLDLRLALERERRRRRRRRRPHRPGWTPAIAARSALFAAAPGAGAPRAAAPLAGAAGSACGPAGTGAGSARLPEARPRRPPRAARPPRRRRAVARRRRRPARRAADRRRGRAAACARPASPRRRPDASFSAISRSACVRARISSVTPGLQQRADPRLDVDVERLARPHRPGEVEPRLGQRPLADLELAELVSEDPQHLVLEVALGLGDQRALDLAP